MSYLAPFSHEDARTALEGFVADAERGGRIVLAAFDGDGVVGTVQVILAVPPNQPHRGEIAKLLVHRTARRRGIAELLMRRAEDEARSEGKTLLVLDAVTEGDAYRLYSPLGWQKVGDVPDFALWPEGGYCSTTYFYRELV